MVLMVIHGFFGSNQNGSFLGEIYRFDIIHNRSSSCCAVASENRGFDSKKLVRTGIYSKIRHPMYLGFILWIIGFPLFMQSFITLASSVIWIPQIMYWKISEESKLEEMYKEYREYKKRTWF